MLRHARLRHRLSRDWSDKKASMLLLEPTLPSSEENVALSSLRNFLLCDTTTQRYSYGPCRIVRSEKHQRNELSDDNADSSMTDTVKGAKPQLIDTYPLFLPAFFHCAVPKVSIIALLRTFSAAEFEFGRRFLI